MGLCVGDCNKDGVVSIDELLVGINIALGNMMPNQCPTFDENGDGSVTVDELLAAVDAALNGCDGRLPLLILSSDFLVRDRTP